MSDIFLSFCVPTYNRPERIYKLINQIISLKYKEIELVIGDDNPLNIKTQEVVKGFNDSRIKYFKNKINLGFDGNIIRVINRASGEFVFLMMDDDDIEVETIPWILKAIKENKHISQLCGSIGNKNPTYKTRYHPYYFKYNYGEKYLKQGPESLLKLLFYYPHGSGIVLRKKALNLKSALKYNGFYWMQQVLIGQALLAGDTLCTSKTFAHIGEVNYNSDLPLIRGKSWEHIVSNIYQIRIRIQIIYDLTKENRKIRKILLNRQIGYLSDYFFRILYYRGKLFSFMESLNYFIEGIAIILPTKLSKFPRFWINLLIGMLIIYIKKNKIKILNRFLS